MYGSLFGTNTSRNGGDNDDDTDDPATAWYVEASGKSRSNETQISLARVHHSLRQAIDSSFGTTATTDNTSTTGATTTSCVINLANTIIGAGMLGLPGALGGTGYWGGALLMALGAFFSAHGLILLSKAAQQAGLPSSFYTVARAAVPQYTVLIDLAVALKCFGVATGYLITVGDCMVDALDHILMTKDTVEEESAFIQTILSRQFWVLGAVLAVLPVSFYRTLDELKKASALALVFVLLLAFGIVAYANGLADPCLDMPEGTCKGEIEAFTTPARTFSKLPIFVFAFTCHQNIFPIVNELQDRSQKRLDSVVAISIGMAFLLFLLVAMEGYRTFGSNVRGDILLNYPETANVTILRICIAFMLTLHYPLQLDPSRRCISSLIQVIQQHYTNRQQQQQFHRRDSDMEQASEHSNLEGSFSKKLQEHQTSSLTAISTTDISDSLFYTITIAFLLLSFGVAMIVDDLGVVLAMVGATGSTLVSYILPGLIYIKIHPTLDLSKLGAYLQFGLGCFIMPVALYFVILGRVRE